MSRWITILGTICALCARQAAAAPAPAAPSDLRFAQLVQDYFKGYFDFAPAEASDIGFHDRDDRLPDFSRAAIERERRRLQSAFETFSALDVQKLSRDNVLDLRVLLASISAQRLELGEVRSWQRQPAWYGERLGWAIYTLVKRNFAPPEQRLRSVIARERQVPAFLRAAEENLENPPQLWVEIALEETQGTVDFLEKDVPSAFAGVGDPTLRAQFAEATRIAATATRNYVTWLRTQLLPRAHGDFRLGEATFRKKLSFEEMVDTPIDALLATGTAELARQQARFARTAAQIDPSANGQAVLQKLAHQHTKPAKLLAETQNLLTSLRDFCVEHQILDLPSLQLPIVAETPPFARAFTFAAMDTPGAFEQKAREAYFYMTLPEPGWTADHIEEHMQAYWRGDIANTAIHEAYPGHYVQFLWLPSSPTFTRKILGANSFIEGWAHYVEEMLLEEGYGGQDPELWLSEEQWALVRICRYLVGIRMHTRGMTLEEGTAFFEKNAYLTHANALREAQRGTADPTYLYYTLGKLQIRQLRHDVELSEGPRFSLRRFHDRLLSQGMPPLAIVREAMGLPPVGDVQVVDLKTEPTTTGAASPTAGTPQAGNPPGRSPIDALPASPSP